jgi:hypothetical protein
MANHSTGATSGATGRRPQPSPDLQMERPWAVAAEAIAVALATDPAAGLTAEEAAARPGVWAPTSWSSGHAGRPCGC